jgi:3D (Asp-Asp-Asp) domain-containing protein
MSRLCKVPRVATWLCTAWFAALALPAAAADARELQERIDTDLFGLPAPTSFGERLQLWATWYHVHSVDAIPDGVRLLDVAGAPISPPVPGRDWCLGALQGVILIKAADGAKRTYTYETTAPKEEVDCVDYFKHPASWTRAAGRSRFGVSTGPFGDGAGGFQVVPFRSIAVDTRLIPLGTVLYIPAARGTAITLPSGRKAVHDGYFFASDRGGAIKDNHIDVFAGLWTTNPFPSFIWSTESRTFDAYVIIDEIVKPRLHRLHALDGGESTRYAGQLNEGRVAKPDSTRVVSTLADYQLAP